MPLIERDYMRDPARTHREQRRRRVRFSMPPLIPPLPRSAPVPTEEGDPGRPDRGRFWLAYAAIVVSVGVIGAVVAMAVREAL